MRQRGNILFLILLAIVLFVALSYAITQSTGGSAKNASGESVKTKAASILQWLDTIDAAVLRMRVTEGIPIQNISFEYTVTKYDGSTNQSSINTNCSVDSCKIFKPAGGNIPSTWFKNAAIADPPGWLAGYPAPGFYDFMMIPFPYAGTDANDVVLRIIGIDNNVCNEINAALSIPVMPGTSGSSDLSAYPVSNWDLVGKTISTGAGQLLGKSTFGIAGSGCIIYHVVITR